MPSLDSPFLRLPPLITFHGRRQNTIGIGSGSCGAPQRRASHQTRKGRCSTLKCCMFLSLNRLGFKETCRR
ncbi:hypothetical protein EPK84_06320 (plasmid) [Sinorhizobium fredii]|nr:hypothetical protein [Sinorhizobium fredii]UTY46504.1 hypothetical protein EPK84_06320 [Sinorhizobium fredii]